MSYTYRRGALLTQTDQHEVLRAYVHRCTVENFRERPDVAARAYASGFRMRLMTDAEWLRATDFAVRKDGRLDRRANHCLTHYDPADVVLGIGEHFAR